MTQPQDREPVTVFVCPPPCDHAWDGPPFVTYYPSGRIAGESVTCSKCGIDAMSVDLMEAP